MKHCSIVVLFVCVSAALGGCSLETAGDELAAKSSAIHGRTAEPDRTLTYSPIGTVALIVSERTQRGCSGSLAIRMDKILTAAHCVCGERAEDLTVRFQQNVGKVYRVRRIAQHPEWAAMSECPEKPAYNNTPAVNDLAVLTLETPLAEADGVIEYGPAGVYTLPHFIGADWLFNPEYAIAGYGSDLIENGWPVRYWGRTLVELDLDECDFDPWSLCSTEEFWRHRIVPEDYAVLDRGDSGGPLLALRKDSLNFAIVGVASMSTNRTDVWASTLSVESNYNFLVNNLAPEPRSVADTAAKYAVFGNETTEINDRAVVVDANNEPAAVGSGNAVMIGADARVGAIDSFSDVVLRDRALVTGDIHSGGATVKGYGATVSGWTTEFLWQPKANLTLPVSFALPVCSPPSVVVEPGTQLVAEQGCIYDSVIVHAGARIVFSPGASYLRGLIVDEGGVLGFSDRTQATQLFIENSLTYRGTSEALAANLLAYMALGGATLSGAFAGTVVVPNGGIVIDAPYKVQVGSFLGRHLIVHQGQWVKHVPYAHPWP